MRHFSLVLLSTILFSTLASAQAPKFERSGNDRFSIKAQAFMGKYMDPSGNIVDIDPNAPTGLNLGIEFPSSQQRPWQQYLNNPTVGLGLSYLNLGNDTMGEGLAMYPYIMINAYRTSFVQMKVKIASGIAFVNGHYKATITQPIPNKTYGSLVNAYLSTGLNLDFPITRNFKINGELGFYHMSNGRTVEPNKGSNILYGGLGLIATINPEEENEKEPIEFPDLPYKWSINITGSAGAHNADMEDAHKYLITTFHVGAIYSVCNWYGVGAGLDIFYNDAIGQQETHRGMYRPTEDDWRRLRGGASINNEFKFGDVTAMLGWGVYLFNPVRNLYDNEHPIYGTGPRPLFYKAEETGQDEAFHYIRFGLKYRVADNVYLQALAKTHMHICELIEFGIGYQIPFLRKGVRNPNGGKIFHHSRRWWEKY